MLIGLWIRDEYSYDRAHPNYDRIAQVMQNEHPDGAINTARSTPIPLANEPRITCGHACKQVTISYWLRDHILFAGDKKLAQKGKFFATAGAGSIGITLLTVSYQAIKAAVANPIKSLRTE